MKIRKLVIKNFRGIKNLEWFPEDDQLVCLVGHGDSTKTTILKAIEYVLYPKYNLNIKDTDFYLCDPISNPIDIEITIGDLPEHIKYRDDLKRFWNKLGSDFCELASYENDNSTIEIVYNVILRVSNTLEPTWEMRGESENTEGISSKMRGIFNLTRLDSYGEHNFKWKYNTLLTKLTERGFDNDLRSILATAGRETRKNFDSNKLPIHLAETANLLSAEARVFGVGHEALYPNLDIFSPDAICLHDSNGVPIYMLGEGSKKLLLLAMEKALLEIGGDRDGQHVILVDEIERGLEPHRLRHLIILLKQLMEKYSSQSIMTTHSPTTIVEIGGFGVYRVVNNSGDVSVSKVSDVSKIRKEPEGFFIDRVVLCEGNTELGILRALKNKWIKEEGSAIENRKTYFIRSHGDEVSHYAKSFSPDLGYKVCLYCDSDKSLQLPDHVEVFQYDEPMNVEQALCKDAPSELFEEIVKFCEESKIEGFPLSIDKKYNQEDRKKIAIFLHDYQEKGVFRTIGSAESLGKMISKYFDKFPEKSSLIVTLTKIKEWIYDRD